MSEHKWLPNENLTPVDVAFPARVSHLMPEWDDIPKEFRDYNSNGKWNKFFSDCFHFGIKDLKLKPNEGIDPVKAMTHIRCIMGSFEPKHEHKGASIAYLMSLWFDDVMYTVIAKKVSA